MLIYIHWIERTTEQVRYMFFSKRSRYGIRALIDLAQNAGNGSIQLSEIADRNDISVKYLEQIFSMLRKAGIIRSIKGPQGGYFLARHSGDLTVADIVAALDGSYYLDREEVQDGGKGEAAAQAVQAEIIEPLNEWVDQFLNALTLKNLVECAEQYGEVLQDMYYI